MGGFELCKEIRQVNAKIPILMLTALGSTDDKLEEFDAGADDYMVKPFDFRELLARVSVLLKRNGQEYPQEPWKMLEFMICSNHSLVKTSPSTNEYESALCSISLIP